ncbi:hypothetical protein AHiyo8_51580 [Arthrobacter sp. Hiyo8]|nr:hypothetical protein AHiyo8_51580 [Arthrobacter sp. Hiyo8]
MGFIEDPRDFDADPGESVYREEAAVIQFAVGPAPADQFVVLARMDVAGVVTFGVASFGQREAVIEVAQFAVEHFQLVDVVIAA